MYEPRLYRQEMGDERFKSFIVRYLDTDLWIGVNPGAFDYSMKRFIENKIKELRKQLILVNSDYPGFFESHKPIEIDDPKLPAIAAKMILCSGKAGIGPMGAVAGLFAEEIGKAMIEKYAITELIIENGGDIFYKLEKSITMKIFAGTSPLSNKLGIKLSDEAQSGGICTSSGKFGHSYSYGKADSVTIICKDTALADVYATAICNKIQCKDDIDTVIQKLEEIKEIETAIIIIDDKVGIKSSSEILML